MSSTTLGPSRPSTCEIRPATPLRAVPVSDRTSISCVARASSPYSSRCTPMKTPVRVPRSVRGTCRPSSRAAHAVSSARRCCGSIWLASRGEMPKKLASNRSTSSTNPPKLGGSFRSSPKRSAAVSVIASMPSRSSCQNCVASCAPGSRQPTPTIAIGSGSLFSWLLESLGWIRSGGPDCFESR